jgi:hypothetical protein
VIDLRTGTRSAYAGGLYRAGKGFSIPELSWTADSRSVVFLGLWCNFPAASNPCTGTMSGTDGCRATDLIRNGRLSSLPTSALDRYTPVAAW